MWNNPWMFWSYRRKLLDMDLEKARGEMKGIILDVGGGRKRGVFEEPENATWIVIDAEKDFQPVVIGDAHRLPFKGGAFDCVKCTELLEHVEHPEVVVREIERVLSPSGVLILSTPFSTPIHGDPYDFHRFSDAELRRMLDGGFKIMVMKKEGLFFTVVANMVKMGVLSMTSPLKRILYMAFPLLDLLVKFDDFGFVKNSDYLTSFTTGFFVVAEKIPQNTRRNMGGRNK